MSSFERATSAAMTEPLHHETSARRVRLAGRFSVYSRCLSTRAWRYWSYWEVSEHIAIWYSHELIRHSPGLGPDGHHMGCASSGPFVFTAEFRLDDTRPAYLWPFNDYMFDMLLFVICVDAKHEMACTRRLPVKMSPAPRMPSSRLYEAAVLERPYNGLGLHLLVALGRSHVPRVDVILPKLEPLDALLAAQRAVLLRHE